MRSTVALAALVGPDLDPYVVEALAGLVAEHPLDLVIAALARHHVDERAVRVALGPPFPTSPPVPRPGIHIHRNGMPQPWHQLERLYAQLAHAAGDAPTARQSRESPAICDDE